jgi:methylmalonyl-CoA mutase N-terminal domain/subunit
MEMFNKNYIKRLAKLRDRWFEKNLRKQLDSIGERKDRFETDSGIPVKSLYTPLDLQNSGFEYMDSLGFPGEFPFTRGITPNMYRSEVYNIAQFTGFSSPEETNKLYKKLLKHGMNSLYMALDLPCQLGYDSDDPLAEGEVGKTGVAINSLKDMETILDGIDLSKTRVTIVANANAAVIVAMLVVIAEKQGVDKSKIRGFVQNDILKDFSARGTYIFPIEPSLRLHSDIVVYCKENLPNFNPFNPISYQIREAGANAVQEAAFTLANAAVYVENALKRGVKIDDLGPIFFTIIVNHRDFFEEIAKIRAMRRIWARLMRDKFGAKKEETCALRFHASQGAVGLNLRRALPETNIVRSTLSGFAGVLAGAQSVGTRTMDEAFGIPSEKASLISLRALQIIAEETGVTNTIDPLAGSYYVEWLTNEIEERINAYLDTIREMGGMVQAIERGYIQQEITRSALAYQTDFEKKKKITVGMNLYIDKTDEYEEHVYYHPDHALELRQIEKLREFKRKRECKDLAMSLEKIRIVALKEESNENNLMYPIIDAVRKYATTGEIFGVLREVFGEYEQVKII